MAVRTIVRWPDARLRAETEEVPEITDEIRNLYRDLCDTMFAENGVGIAAIQIGNNARMFLIEGGGRRRRQRLSSGSVHQPRDRLA